MSVSKEELEAEAAHTTWMATQARTQCWRVVFAMLAKAKSFSCASCVVLEEDRRSKLPGKAEWGFGRKIWKFCEISIEIPHDAGRAPVAPRTRRCEAIEAYQGTSRSGPTDART
ncbi:uncharacterized protein CCOS01_05741 [Colletotrichum costaricense]|uniref:Uncharacterized protein n=1 Tax=Colletotrichum costaricense TaxID=1209916 RepID=A0AAJ0E1X2_9PEZI|nr:uncharacterized protein CCOS01_05741 [Colletotrichum costaricense]KAI3530969.1 hypothetical protein CSPX01_14495 [Colletotrichum filicis]KAK1530638.1 hypothetical protein CCOS01_05741 [Colletotrichum costaricense]